jgi:predicted O-methyltransferase YrrM
MMIQGSGISPLPYLFENTMAKREKKIGSESKAILTDMENETTVCPVECLQHQEELNWLLEKVKALKPVRILEIGSLFGGTLWHWMQLAGEGAKIVSVDMMVAHDAPQYAKQLDGHLNLWQKWAAEKGIDLTIIEGSSTHPDTIDRVRSLLSKIDLLFIDGDHEYEYVKCDYTMYSPMVREGGLIVFHDIVSSPGQVGVNKFWNELKLKHTTEEFSVGNNRGIGVYVKGKEISNENSIGIFIK